MAEWDPPVQPSRWSSEVQAPPLADVPFPKEAQLQAATISLWTVVGAVQAVERTVEAQALRLLSLEQRSGVAEKRFADCEKAIAEFRSQLGSRWSALGTLVQEYGQLQRRLENMENLLKDWNFWVFRVPVGSATEASKDSGTPGACSSHFSREKWEKLEEWQKELYKNTIKGNCEPLASLDFAVSKLENFATTEQADQSHGQDLVDSEQHAQEPPSESKTESSVSRTEIISWIKQEEESCTRENSNAEEGGLCENPCNYYTVSQLGSLPSDGEGILPCVPLRVDLEAEAAKGSPSARAGSPALGTEVISWVKQEPAASSARGAGDAPEAFCNSPDRAQRQAAEAQGEDPANPPLLLFFPGGSVAPILNGAIGESQPLSNLRGPRASGSGGSKPSPPAAGALEPAAHRPHTCLECGKTFSLLLSLQVHQMNHQKRRQYECAYCGAAFSCPSELVRHQMIHTGERPYRCTVCGKGFVRKQHLIPHLRLHTGERPYHCAECGKDFICKHHLLEHQRAHTGEKPYACPQCGKTFRRKKSLKDHLRVHSPQQGQADSAAAALPQGLERAATARGEEGGW